MDATEQQGSLETPQDAGEGKPGIVKRWLLELALSDKTEQGWRKNAQDTLDRYRDEKSDLTSGYSSYSSQNRYNILYSNVQTICPALFNQTPKPDVRRRFRDQDPVGKMISEVLERALSYTVDAQDFDRYMRFAVKDSQIQGRGVTRVKYKPTFGMEYGEEKINEETGEYEREEYEALKFEEVCFEHVDWKDFRRGPANKWEDCPWVAFRHTINKEQGLKQFGPAFEDVDLDHTVDGANDEDENNVEDTYKRALVWEIWCKESRKVYFIAPSMKEQPLKIDEDPLNLQEFFPIPRPLYAIEDTSTLVPCEPFRFYRDQAKELDEITKRISAIIKACKVRGVYDSTLSEMSSLMDSGENILQPSENVLSLLSQGGLDKAIWMFPIQQIAQVLVHLYAQREQIKTTIYEITGIADIMRGSSSASETLGAQQLKAQFGSMRLDDMKRDVQRYARDLVRIAAEIIAEKFSPKTLTIMTGKMVDNSMLEVMQNDGPRGFRIDIETDSTVSGDVATEQKNMTEMLGGIAQFLQAIGPTVQAGYIPAEAGKSMLVGAIRRFKMGREVEDALEMIGNEQQQGQGQSQQDQAAMQAQMQQQQEAQAQQAELMLKKQAQEQEFALKRETALVELQNSMHLKREEMAMNQQAKAEELAMKERVARYSAELQAQAKNNATVISAQTQQREVM